MVNDGEHNLISCTLMDHSFNSQQSTVMQSYKIHKQILCLRQCRHEGTTSMYFKLRINIKCFAHLIHLHSLTMLNSTDANILITHRLKEYSKFEMEIEINIIYLRCHSEVYIHVNYVLALQRLFDQGMYMGILTYNKWSQYATGETDALLILKQVPRIVTTSCT